MFFITFVPLNPRSKNVHFVLKIGTFRFADYTYLDNEKIQTIQYQHQILLDSIGISVSIPPAS